VILKQRKKDNPMQLLAQNRSLNRLILLVFVTALIIIASWRLTSTRGLSSRLEEAYAYLADSASRTSAPTDKLIQSLQDRLRANPNDWQSYSQLGLAYLQKARETGDPTFYQKTDEALE
jgi:cytochrome c-type biogenesis protein CcmH/NrfG